MDNRQMGVAPIWSLRHLGVRQEPISKSCKTTQADNLNRRRRLSRKAECLRIEVGKVIKIFLA